MNNHLRLFSPDGAVDIERTCTFAGVTLEKALTIFESSSSKKDARFPPKFMNRMKELATALEFVAETFDGNVANASFWWRSPNPEFGGLSPFDLFIRKRYKPVFKMILGERRQMS